MKKIVISLLFLLLVLKGYSQQTNNFDDVCGALIFNVSRYVVWESVSGDFEIVVIHQSKIADNLKKYFTGRKINGADVKIIEDKSSRNDFSGVELLISHKKIEQPNLLTIDINGINGIVNFVEENGKVKLKVRKESLEKNGLKMSSALTSMVEIIE
jgi:hypothetical protein